MSDEKTMGQVPRQPVSQGDRESETAELLWNGLLNQSVSKPVAASGNSNEASDARSCWVYHS
jgi:hypothetical protein